MYKKSMCVYIYTYTYSFWCMNIYILIDISLSQAPRQNIPKLRLEEDEELLLGMPGTKACGGLLWPGMQGLHGFLY